MKWKLKRCIKNSVNNNTIFKIVSVSTGKFKVGGNGTLTNECGKTWNKLSDVRKAFNLIPEEYRKDFKIVELSVKLKDIKEY